MNGPEHYKEAERLLSKIPDAMVHAERMKSSPESLIAVITMATSEAQVHATLALVAATAAMQATAYDGDEQNARSRGWSGVV